MNWNTYLKHALTIEFSNSLQNTTIDNYLVSKIVHDVLAPLNASLVWKDLVDQMNLGDEQVLYRWLEHWLPLFKSWINELLELQQSHSQAPIDVDTALNNLHSITANHVLAVKELHQIPMTTKNRGVLTGLLEQLDSLEMKLKFVSNKDYEQLLLS